MMRRLSAVVAAGIVLSGCASGGDGEGPATASPPVAEATGNPWDLPLEQRPPLFDPCTEIPAETLAKVGYADRDRIEGHTYANKGTLKACDWGSPEVLFGVYSTWDDRATVLSRSDNKPIGRSEIAGRPVEILSGAAAASDSECHAAFFTSKGTVVVTTVFTSSLHTYKGEYFVDICSVLREKASEVAEVIPKGDFW